MALADDIEFYGRAVAAGDMDQPSAITCLVAAGAGGLTQQGAADLITNWQAARARYQQEINRADAALAQILRKGEA